MFSYICLGTANLERAVRFYDAALGALGYLRCDTTGETCWDGWAGWGTYLDQGRTQEALWVCAPFDGKAPTSGNGTMIALQARTWKQVDEFYAAALANGGCSEGSPNLRPHYNADFYAAYVRDPDGNKLAAVCRGYTQRSQDDR
jgi:catechol 2,3-dioxygenase-like lactoylglutathione lyase family enzyme